MPPEVHSASNERQHRDGPHTPSRVPSSPSRRRALRRDAVIGVAMLATALVLVAASAPLANVPLLRDGLRGNALAAFSGTGLAFAVLVSAAGLLITRRGSRSEAAVMAIVVAATIGVLDLVAGSPSDLLQAAALVAFLPIAVGRVRRLFDRHMPLAPQRIVVIGSGDIAERTLAALSAEPAALTEVVGYVDEPDCYEVGGLRRLGSVSDLRMIVRAHAVDRIVVAFSKRTDADILECIRGCDGLNVEVSVVPRLFDVLPIGGRVDVLGQLPIITVGRQASAGPGAVVKRATDVVGASLLLVVFAPIFIAAAMAVLVTSGRPVIFTQKRIGHGGKTFKVLKFRTMKQVTDRSAERITDLASGTIDIATAVDKIKRDGEQRITRVGNLLRKSSVDELPQLVNVVKGEMSLVGPRPLRDFEVAQLEGWQRRRIDARPGMTGLWQVSGRSDVSWDDRVQLDYRYVRHWSVGEDVKILAKTLPAVLAKRGAV